MLRSAEHNTPFKVRIWGYINEFMLYSLAGWLYETVAESIFAKQLVLNRGYLHLPVCPIYGVGAFIAIWIMHRFGKLKKWQVFLCGTVITTVVEYIAALIIEAVLHRTLWDYTPWICDFQGRVSLISSLIFGIGCVGAYSFRPFMEKYCIEKNWLRATAIIEVSAVIVDFVLIALGF